MKHICFPKSRGFSLIEVAVVLVIIAVIAAILTPLAAPAPHASAIQVSAVVERPAVAPVLVTRPAQTAVAHGGQTVEQLAKLYGGDVSARLFAQGLCLPSGSALSESDQDRVVTTVLAARRAAVPIVVARPLAPAVATSVASRAAPLPNAVAGAAGVAAIVVTLPGDAWCVVPAAHPAHRSTAAARALGRALTEALDAADQAALDS